MGDRTISYKIKMSKDGKKATITIESTQEILVDDFIAVAEAMQSRGDEESGDKHHPH